MIDNIIVEKKKIESRFLNREVGFDAYLPVNVSHPEKMELLLINDGQDLPKMPFDEIFSELLQRGKVKPLVCVGIYCGEDRKMEYGMAGKPDYKGWGAKAGLYTRFILEELIPYISNTYYLPSIPTISFAGFSLGALSAMDIAWNQPDKFSKVGVFSGSLWWRSVDYDNDYEDDKHRMMHQQVRLGKYHAGLKFFLQCGEQDEKADRNNNGIIDSVDDTLALVNELKAKGYSEDSIYYLLVPDGMHDVSTWGRCFPEFLKWGWGKK